MTIAEIAVVMECSESTVKLRLNYGKAKVRKEAESLEKSSGTKLYSAATMPIPSQILRSVSEDFTIYITTTEKKVTKLHTNFIIAERQSLDKGGIATMNAKQELAARIMMLAYDELKPDTQRVLDLLCDYRIDHSLGIEEMDFMRQVNHFLGAKRSEGMAKLSTYSYRRRLDIFYNHNQ